MTNSHIIFGNHSILRIIAIFSYLSLRSITFNSTEYLTFAFYKRYKTFSITKLLRKRVTPHPSFYNFIFGKVNSILSAVNNNQLSF